PPRGRDELGSHPPGHALLRRPGEVPAQAPRGGGVAGRPPGLDPGSRRADAGASLRGAARECQTPGARLPARPGPRGGSAPVGRPGPGRPVIRRSVIWTVLGATTVAVLLAVGFLVPNHGIFALAAAILILV